MRTSMTLARTLAFVSLAAVLAGCKTASQVEITQSIPDDYRQRHPIAVREKVQSMTVFIGDARGTLTPTQRAEVAALASSWRQDRRDPRSRHPAATGPSVQPRARCTASRSPSVRSGG